MEVLIVTGGWNRNDSSLASTEALNENAETWRLTASLPSARYGLRAASVENNIFVFGENILHYTYIDISVMLLMFIVTISLQEAMWETENI